MPAPAKLLCHWFSSFVSHRLFLSSGISVPAFPRVSHRVLKEDIDALKVMCIRVSTKSKVG